ATPTPTPATATATATPTPTTNTLKVAPGQAAKLAYDGATLDVGAAAVTTSTVLSITPLTQDDLSALDEGMANATAGPRVGYRFLPHNTKFKDKITISLPYDPALIPQGLSEQDLKTFYFDDQLGMWQELDRVTVDTANHLVVSQSDHFTDMINAAVTVPDHPQTLSYNPNSLKEIKAADPGAGINLIELPQPNNKGDARLSYPIEVPPGRAGMQPQLAVSYTSGEHNGWLGLGWDVSLSAITIDTRWGVPRYDAGTETEPARETETYLLDGEQLTPPAHPADPQPRPSPQIFHTPP